MVSQHGVRLLVVKRAKELNGGIEDAAEKLTSAASWSCSSVCLLSWAAQVELTNRRRHAGQSGTIDGKQGTLDGYNCHVRLQFPTNIGREFFLRCQPPSAHGKAHHNGKLWQVVE